MTPSMTPKRLFAPAAALLLLASAQPGSAQTTGELAVRLFTQLDRDRDGRVTAKEFTFMRGIDFGRLDRNGDGIVDRREFVDRRSPPNAVSARARRIRRLRIQRFAELDADRDGRISRQEYMRYGRRLFARLDRDGNGVIVLNEVAPAAGKPRAKRAEPRPQPVPRPDSARPPGRVASAKPGPNVASRPGTDSVFARLDLNHDGSITFAEVVAARRAVFQRLDSDRNGALSRAEFVVTGNARARRFAQLDRNRDGRISLSEYLNDGRARFRAADANKDGRLSRAEFAKAAGG
jgi:Ca2+-binding EF-hand superfamily protein